VRERLFLTLAAFLPDSPNMKLFAIEGKNPQHCATDRPWWAAAITIVLLLSSRPIAQIPEVPPSRAQIQNKSLIVQFDRGMRSRVVAQFGNKQTALGPFVVSESVASSGKSLELFHLFSEKSERIREGIGAGQRLTVSGKAGHLTKTVTVTTYDDFPTMAFFDVQYTNNGRTNVAIS
jgi:alpha-galactosidase